MNENTRLNQVIEGLEDENHTLEHRALEAEAKLTEFQVTARQAAVAQVEAEIRKQRAQVESELMQADRDMEDASQMMEEHKRRAEAAAEVAAQETKSAATAVKEAEAQASVVPDLRQPPPIAIPAPAPQFVAPLSVQRGGAYTPVVPRRSPVKANLGFLPGTFEEMDSLRKEWLG